MKTASNTQALNRRLVLLKLSRPGGCTFGIREDNLFARLCETSWVDFAIREQGLSEHSDDLTQEVFLSLCEEIRLGVLHSLNSAYVKNKVRNLATKIRGKRERTTSANLDEFVGDQRAVISEDAEAVDVLMEAMRMLPGADRKLLEGRFPNLLEHGREASQRSSLKELAKEMGVDISTVSRRLSRVVSLLADLLRRRGFDRWAGVFEDRTGRTA